MGAPLPTTPPRGGRPPPPDSDVIGPDDELQLPAQQPHPAPWRPFLVVGALIDVLDSHSLWMEAEVINIVGQRVLVHFVFWSSRFDEWLGAADERMQAHGTRTYQRGGVPQQHQLVDVYTDAQRQRYSEALIMQVLPGRGAGDGGLELLVRLVSQPGQPEETIPLSSGRILPFGALRTRRQYRPSAKSYWGGRSRDAQFASAATDPRVVHYLTALAAARMRVQPVGGDGNCLFRSVAHQVYGDQELHGTVRAAVAEYMEVEAAWFASFVVGDAAEFSAYVAGIRTLGVWGDDPEVQAVCEIYNRPAEIYAYDAAQGAKKLRVFHGAEGGGGAGAGGAGAGGSPTAPARPLIRLSYYGGGHYDSIEGPGWRENLLPTAAAAGPSSAASVPGTTGPGTVEQAAIEAARQRNRPGGLADALRASDAVATEAEAMQAALAASREAFDASEANVEQQLLLGIRSGEPGAGGTAAPPLQPAATLSSSSAAAAGESFSAAGAGGPGAGAASLEESILAAVLRSSQVDAAQQFAALQTGSEDEALRAALAASARPSAGGAPSGPFTATLMRVEDEEEEEDLQAALQMSLEGTAPSSSSSSSSSAAAAARAQALPAMAGDSDALFNRALEMSEDEQIARLLMGDG